MVYTVYIGSYGLLKYCIQFKEELSLILTNKNKVLIHLKVKFLLLL